MQNVHKPSKPQVRDFPAPQGFHAPEVERFQPDVVVLGTQIMRQLPMKRLADIGYPAMHAGQMGFGPSAVM